MRAEGGAWVNEGKPTEHMESESGPLEDERNPQPEPLEDDMKQESMGAEGEAWDGGIPQPEPWGVKGGAS
jgi:hypothetical protein